MTTIIERENHPYAFDIRRSWEDEAHITGEQFVERVLWYRNTETDQVYYDLFACIGWPAEFADRGEGVPGYVGIVGVVKSESVDIKKANFQLLAEYESKDVPTLIEAADRMRRTYGFGKYPNLLTTFFGNPDRFISLLALYNEQLERVKRNTSIVLSIPNDFYEQKAFDIYIRSFRSAITQGKARFYFGKNEILKSRLGEFAYGDPAILAIGGLVHTLMFQCMWMDYARSNTFNIED